MSSEPQAHAVAEPDSSDAALVDALLDELGQSRVGLLAEFVRAYVRRVPPLLVGELGTSRAGRPRRRPVRVHERARARRAGGARVQPRSRESDGWHAAGSVVEVSVEDSPFLVDTVSTEMHVHGLQVRAVVHPVMGVERSKDGRIEAITPARGAPRRESVMYFQADRRLDAEALDQLRSSLL